MFHLENPFKSYTGICQISAPNSQNILEFLNVILRNIQSSVKINISKINKICILPFSVIWSYPNGYISDLLSNIAQKSFFGGTQISKTFSLQKLPHKNYFKFITPNIKLVVWSQYLALYYVYVLIRIKRRIFNGPNT